MEVPWDALDSIIRELWGLVVSMIQRLVGDSSYRAGFFACFITIVVVGGLSRLIAWAWALVQAFFHHTHAPPAPGQGPTPAGITSGCAEGAVVLALLALVALFVLSRLVSP